MTATAETTDWTRMEVFELLTMNEKGRVPIIVKVDIDGREERTKIDSIYFAVNDDSCTLATKDVDRLINFNVVDGYSLGLLKFLRASHRFNDQI